MRPRLLLADATEAKLDALLAYDPRPVVVEFYCCQGGMATGLHDHFNVLGVDLYPQPHFPYPMVQGDALEFLDRFTGWLRRRASAVTGGPPCQRYSLTQRIQGNEHPDLIAPTRNRFQRTGLPYVIENVEEARGELRDPVMLCDAAFGIRTYRHRLFEIGGGFTLNVPTHPEHTAPTRKMGRPPRDGENMHIVGNFPSVDLARQIMGMPHATRDGLREAIPVEYGRWIAGRLAEYLARVAVPVQLDLFASAS